MDFCSSLLGCKISVDKPSADDYEVANLISDSSNGFISESFVRPPINIKISFPLPIEISYIKLETQIGERITTGFKICLENGKEDSRSDSCDNEFKPRNVISGNDQLPKTSVPVGSNSPIYTNDTSNGTCLGNWYSVTENRVILKNYHYKHWLSLPLPKEEKGINCFVGALRSPNKNDLKFVNALVLTITNVRPNGPSVLKRIGVWGQPSITTSPNHRKKMLQLWHVKCKRDQIQCAKLPTMYSYSRTETLPDVKTDEFDNNSTTTKSTVIPDDYLDPLTCEIMKLPILLPSGNSVDSFTLDKFILHEAMWGRPASDPFTGVPFRSGYKPEPNVHLKSRIDRFLLVEKNLPQDIIPKGQVVRDEYTGKDHAIKHRSLKRKSIDIATTKEKRIVTIHSLDSEPSSSNSNALGNVGCPSNVNKISEPSNMSTVTKRSGSFSDVYKSSEHSNMTLETRTMFPNVCKTSEHSNKATETKNYKNSSFTHKTNGRHSLIQSLGSAVNLTSKRSALVNLKGSSVDKKNDRKCKPKSSSERLCEEDKYSLTNISSNCLQCECGNRIGPFYSLSCLHNICINCLKSNDGINLDTDISCTTCGLLSNRKQINRIHPKSAFAR